MKNITNEDVHHIPNTEARDHNPIWSPDGEIIYFMRTADSDPYFIKTDGSGMQRILSGPEYERLIGRCKFGKELFYAVGETHNLP
jgi:hypothetical protein